MHNLTFYDKFSIHDRHGRLDEVILSNLLSEDGNANEITCNIFSGVNVSFLTLSTCDIKGCKRKNVLRKKKKFLCFTIKPQTTVCTFSK